MEKGEPKDMPAAAAAGAKKTTATAAKKTMTTTMTREETMSPTTTTPANQQTTSSTAIDTTTEGGVATEKIEKMEGDGGKARQNTADRVKKSSLSPSTRTSKAPATTMTMMTTMTKLHSTATPEGGDGEEEQRRFRVSFFLLLSFHLSSKLFTVTALERSFLLAIGRYFVLSESVLLTPVLS